MMYSSKQETSKDSMARLQSKFQNFQNAMINQLMTDGPKDWQWDIINL